MERIQQDISKALGVPYVLLKSGNNANLDANQKLFYTQTVLPIVELFGSAFQHFFFNLGFMKIYPDKSNILCLQADLQTQASASSTLVNGGIITPDEARVSLKYDELGGEMGKIRVPQNITGSATRPDTGGRPSGPKPNKDLGD